MAIRTRLSVDPELNPVCFSHSIIAAWGPQDAFLVTSPNVAYIPEIIQGIVSVYLRDNGGFGKPDPLLWPQVYMSQYPYLTALPKGPKPHLRNTSPPSVSDSAIWAHPSSNHFVPLCNTPVRGFGRWSTEFLLALEPVVKDMASRARRYAPPLVAVNPKPLRQYEQQMTMAWLRLCHVSATYRDQVVQLAAVQRNWWLCSAFMTYYDLVSQPPSPDPLPVDYGLMGAWTSEPNEVQKLFSLGIPVWWVRASHIVGSDTRVRDFVAMASASQVSFPIAGSHIPIYQGLAGPHHLEVTFSIPSYMDLARIPTSIICDPDDYRAIARRDETLNDVHWPSAPPSVGPGCSKFASVRGAHMRRSSPYSVQRLEGSNFVHRSHARGRDKFHDPPHRWMPPPLLSWDRAMHAPDRSRVAKPTEGMWGYWIPEPALLLGGKDPARQHRYLLNWLRAQPVWLYMLQVPGSGAVKVRPQAWRDFLNGVPDDPNCFTRTGKRAYEIRQIFGRVFEEVELDASADGEVE
ncbi:hypothetical protein GSI_03093 [Ganoderma sinense ZZ0214-1]|uniref:Uncharacterized protein n=1 Tax=Ganoderma sinense ZZ0214-1 TaxID=1077348 RepID=A0A2G8SL70_9APHY|nr:hypothetical protein GSI_03093 [Ganoderma sinense ZZ0214-1]